MENSQPGGAAAPQDPRLHRHIVDDCGNDPQQFRRCDTTTVYKIQQGRVSVKRTFRMTFNGDNIRKIDNLQPEHLPDWDVPSVKELSKSICRLHVKCLSVRRQGTGFVLFDNYIMTNAHLFRYHDAFQTDGWIANTTVTAVFNCEDPDPSTWNIFDVQRPVAGLTNKELDYVVLELKPQCQMNQFDVPPGLLNKFSPVPANGEACVIGHPGGSVKKIDPTCVIEKEKRKEAVEEYLDLYKDEDRPTLLYFGIKQHFETHPIKNIVEGGKKADKVVTYKTFMYHGSSGSPVFDANCRVFGLHSGGYGHELPGHMEAVIELAHPLLNIFKSFVTELRDNGNEELLSKVKEAAKGNHDLENILKDVMYVGVLHQVKRSLEYLLNPFLVCIFVCVIGVVFYICIGL
ncbi:protein FAM111A-like [Mastacembelus armatus]|uniref:Protein FAM111A-like n=1 Tax=Mastacembelus armatus TaxID=205130 RepID=A0A7N9AZZ6_9TELE|nr:protein FAM111A-like [Mastacembelus armatus]